MQFEKTYISRPDPKQFKKRLEEFFQKTNALEKIVWCAQIFPSL